MTLLPGSRLGPYEVVASVGAGGMGEVYKARDTRLDRTVALKVLQAQVASDPQFRERFEREARVVSSLEHPHICVLYDVGREGEVDFLVMQFLDGETLAKRLSSGPMPLDQALGCAVEICSALAAAHRRGIVHRDLKPGNVMLTKGGVKLLDFGLAKTTSTPAVAGASVGPTQEAPLTAQGTILGTMQYMAPEQLEGKETDARTDIFAFGAMLYEMITGRKAFQGGSQASLITAIMSAQPVPITASQPLASAAIDHVVRICLAKDPDTRFQSAHDVLVNLKWIVEGASPAAGPAAAGTGDRQRARLRAAALVAAPAIIASLATWSLTRPQRAALPSVVHATIALPAAAPILIARFPGTNVAISPDGTHIVYAGASGDRSQLYRRSLDRLDVAPIAGTQDALNPFFSPDGQWLAFHAGGKLKKVPIVGGGSVPLCDAESVFGGAWSDDGTIIFGGTLNRGLLRVSSDGGRPEPFTSLANGEGSHRWPSLIPGRREVLFAVSSGFNWDDARIAVQSLDSTEHRVLPDLGTSPRYVATGHLVFARAGSLFAAPFDLARLATTGPAAFLLNDVSTTALAGNAQYALSTAGTLIYVPGGQADVRGSLVWVDRKGTVERVPGAVRGFEIPRISPDGKRAAVTIREGDSDVWIVELGRGTLTRITTDAGEDHSVEWTPDGRRVTYSSSREGGRSHIRVKAVDGGGGEDELFVADAHTHLGGWTPDGRILLTDAATASTRSDLYSVNTGDKSPPRLYVQTPSVEKDPRPSPDGRWVAYVSDESSRNEVYVQAFPGPGARRQVSSDGGSEPAWAQSGRELFYRDGDKMMGVKVGSGSTFMADAPRVLFEGQYGRVVWDQSNYDVSPDGGRFLMIKTEAQPPATELRLIVNWFVGLLRGSR